MSENSEANNDDDPTRKNVMYLTMDWQKEIEAIAGPIAVHDSRESWLLRAARKAGITHWHAKALFYGELKDPKWSLGIKVCNAANKARLEAARIDAAALSNQFQQIARGMVNANADLHGADAAALLDAARILGRLDMS